jgi:hypothetical protein
MGKGSEQTSTTSIPKWMEQGGKELYGDAKGVVRNNPYTPYPGQRYAPFNQDQQAAMSMARGNVGSWAPYTGAATGYAQEGARTIGAGDYQRLMNPYTEGMGGILARNINQSYDMSQGANKDLAQMASAYGGDRDALVRAETEKNRNTALNDMWTNQYGAAYDRAGQMFGDERSRMFQGAGAMSNLGGQVQQQGLADIGSIMGIGGQQQGFDQRTLDYLAGEYARVQQDPYEQMRFLSGILNGTPYTQTQTTSGGGASTGQGIAGGAMTGASMGSMFGPWGAGIGAIGGGILGGFM